MGGVILLGVFAVWEIFIFHHPGYTTATGFNFGYGFSVKGVALRIFLQGTILLTGFFVLRLCPNEPVSITKYGRRTMHVYLLHGLIVLPFAYLVFPSFAEAIWWQRIAMMVIPTVLCSFLFFVPLDKLLFKH